MPPTAWPNSAWSEGCAASALGACQPATALGAESCRQLCSRTIGCIGYTFVKPGQTSTQWDRACLGERSSQRRASKALGTSEQHGRCCLEHSLPLEPRIQQQDGSDAFELEPSAWCKADCRVPWPAPSMVDNALPEKIDAQRRRQHGPPTISPARSFPWAELQQRIEHKFRRQARASSSSATRSSGSSGGSGSSSSSSGSGSSSSGGSGSSGSSGSQSSTSIDGGSKQRASSNGKRVGSHRQAAFANTHNSSTSAPRIALCVAGAARTLVHPAIGYAFDLYVRGAIGNAHADVFMVLGTGEEVRQLWALHAVNHTADNHAALHAACALSPYTAQGLPAASQLLQTSPHLSSRPHLTSPPDLTSQLLQTSPHLCSFC